MQYNKLEPTWYEINVTSGLPNFIHEHLIVMTKFGSAAYGVQTKESDNDFMGVYIPPMQHLFPVLKGHILGWQDSNSYCFGHEEENYKVGGDVHHWKFEIIKDDKKNEYNFYSLPRLCQMLGQGNPHAIELISLDNDKIIFYSNFWEKFIANKEFMYSKKVYERFIGYYKSCLGKMSREENWFKSGYHAYRILDELLQIITSHSLKVGDSSFICRGIRTGYYTKEQLLKLCEDQLSIIELSMQNSTLRNDIEFKEVKNVLSKILIKYYQPKTQFERALLILIGED